MELNKCANRDTAPAFFQGTPGYEEEQMFGEEQSKNHLMILWPRLEL